MCSPNNWPHMQKRASKEEKRNKILQAGKAKKFHKPGPAKKPTNWIDKTTDEKEPNRKRSPNQQQANPET